MSKITVNGIEITILKQGETDYVNLTEIVSKFPDGSKLIERWLNSKNTVDFLGVWEQLYNENFNSPDFRGIRENVGSPSYYLSVKKWIEVTNAIGINAKTGRYGGTYAQKDIAFEFASYVDPYFKLLLIKEFQRLKEEEAKQVGGQWDFRRYVAKVNLKLQTDAVKQVLVPITTLPVDKQGILYAEASDVIYLAMYGYTSKQWREKNPELAKGGRNIRDYATSHQLIILANLENIDALLLKSGVTDKLTRIKALRKEAISQIQLLRSSAEVHHELVESPYKLQLQIEDKKKDEGETEFNKNLKGLLSVPPPKKGNT